MGRVHSRWILCAGRQARRTSILQSVPSIPKKTVNRKEDPPGIQSDKTGTRLVTLEALQARRPAEHLAIIAPRKDFAIRPQHNGVHAVRVPSLKPVQQAA